MNYMFPGILKMQEKVSEILAKIFDRNVGKLRLQKHSI